MQNRKCKLLQIVLFCLFLLLNAKPLLSGKTLKVCIYENLPKVFTEENGKPSGMFVEIMEYIAQKEGWKIEYVKGRWADCLERLESGEIDIMVNVPYTPLYSSICKFHRVPVFSSRLQIYARNGINISSILDLNEKPVGI